MSSEPIFIKITELLSMSTYVLGQGYLEIILYKLLPYLSIITFTFVFPSDITILLKIGKVVTEVLDTFFF